MPLYLSGTQITFPDSTNQYTAASAITNLGAVATNAGSAVVIAQSIPVSVNRVQIAFSNVTNAAAGDYLIRLGTSAGWVSTGYVSTCLNSASTTGTSTTGFIINARGTTTDAFSGVVTLIKTASNTWALGGSCMAGGWNQSSGGSVTLAAALTQIQILTTGGGAWSTGNARAMYD